jgi:hypothetical protein
MSAMLSFPDGQAMDAPAASAEELAEALAATLAETAVARDAARGHAAAERELIRASGLLALTVPAGSSSAPRATAPARSARTA